MMDAGKQSGWVVHDEGLVLYYGGIEIEVLNDSAGVPHATLKPVADLLGANWEGQRTRVSSREYSGFFGTRTLKSCRSGQGRSMVCIRLDRMAAYLLSINVAQVRSSGNQTTAEFLASKRREWAEILKGVRAAGLLDDLSATQGA
jgi:P22_AR N-terminal domain